MCTDWLYCDEESRCDHWPGEIYSLEGEEDAWVSLDLGKEKNREVGFGCFGLVFSHHAFYLLTCLFPLRFISIIHSQMFL